MSTIEAATECILKSPLKKRKEKHLVHYFYLPDQHETTSFLFIFKITLYTLFIHWFLSPQKVLFFSFVHEYSCFLYPIERKNENINIYIEFESIYFKHIPTISQKRINFQKVHLKFEIEKSRPPLS